MNDETQQQDDGVNVQTPNVNMEQQQYANYSPSSVANQQHLNFTAKRRLPKITLPRFNGDVTKWNTFWDSFDSAIHSNTDIANIDKFNYLKSLIERPAARAIQGLTLTNDNYDTAVKILEERFGKRQQIVSAHMDELLKIPSCTNDKAHSLRLVYDKISVHTRGLAAISANQYGRLLIPVIMSKLPNEIRLQIARKSTQDAWAINDELLDIIKKEVEAREATERIKADNTQQRGNKSYGHHSTAGAFLSKEDQKANTVRCAYCKELHFSASCTKVTDPEKRKEILRNTNRCFNCLRVGHRISNCQNSKCCSHCKQRHHQSICGTLISPSFNQAKGEDSNEAKTESKRITTTSNMANKGTVLLQTARTTATNSDGSRSSRVRILFDSGSQRSYISNRLKTTLKLKPVKNETLNLNTFGNSKFRKQNCDLVELNLEDKDHAKVTIKALSFPVICSSLPSRINVEEFSHLDGLELADDIEHDGNEEIDVLIGSDYYWTIVTGEMKKGESGPVAVNSKLGWLLSGPLNDSATPTDVQSNLIISGKSEINYGTRDEEHNLVGTLKKFWETETIGIHQPEDTVQSDEFTKHVYRQGDRYEVSLPWKEEHLPIPNNYELSSNRLRSMHFKLQNKPELLMEYDQIIKEQLSSGIVEEVPEKEIEKIKVTNIQSSDAHGKNIHYMPHHAVIRQNRETTKLRMVYDCSAKSNNQPYALNDCLETGPNYIPQLLEVLLRFRWNPIAISADIEKAFLMVGINRNDRDMLRFLWLKNPYDPRSDVIHLRFCRLMFGLRPSPAILGAVLAHHLNSSKQYDPELVGLIKNSMYVDDFLSGSGSVVKGKEIYSNCKQIMKEASFNLRKWHSNSIELLEFIDKQETNEHSITNTSRVEGKKVTKEDESYAKTTVGKNLQSKAKSVNVLGSTWNVETDEFHFQLSELITLAKSLTLTKRSFLRVSSAGVLSLFTILLKVAFQSICVEGLDWDKELQNPYRKLWNSFLSDITQLERLRVPRCYFNTSTNPTNKQFHSFSDASKKAFAAVTYLRSTYPDGHVETRLVASKTRVAPIKTQTIPRLELLGAVMSARLSSTITRSLPNNDEIECIVPVAKIPLICLHVGYLLKI